MSLTTTVGGATTDWLEDGAFVQLSLAANGTTTGRLFVPGAEEGGSDMDVDLTGTWTLHGETVRLKHSADTFLRDMPLTTQGSRLIGDQSFGERRIRLVLQKR